MASTEFNQSQVRSIRVSDSRNRSRTIIQTVVRGICFICASFSIIATVGIFAILFLESIPFFREINIGAFLTGTKWQMSGSEPLYGVLPLVTGTLLITVGSGLVSIPLGLGVGIYLSEYAPDRIRKVLKPVLELLAGVPSVVFGYFALPTLNPMLPEFRPANAAAGAIVVGFMTLPLVSSLCEDAITAVPKALREAAYGLGCTKAEVITKVAIPSAFSGIIASFILALSRAVGETMAVTIAAGARPQLTFNPGDEVMTMTAQIVNVSKGDISRGELRYQSIFAIGLLLFLITFALNIVAQRYVRKMAGGGAK